MKVLCAVDGSQFSKWGAKALGALTDRRPASLVLLHVVESAALKSVAGKHPAKTSRALLEADKRGQRVLQDLHRDAILALSEAATGPRTKVRTRLVHGHIADSVIRQAHREKSDLVVLGSRGLTDIPGFFLGSVAREVASLADLPVWIVKRPLAEITRVALATDGSPHAKTAEQFLRQEFLPQTAHVTVLSVVQPVVTDLEASVLSLSQLRRLSAPLEERAAHLVSSCRERFLQDGFEVETQVLAGHPVLSILQHLEQNRVELVVLGSRGLTGLERLVLGSVSEGILHHAPCSVLIVRQPPN
jgi:nucleotide-binding universal stress UspA family protein